MTQHEWLDTVVRLCRNGFDPDGHATGGAQVQVYDAAGTLVYRQPIARDVRLEAGEPVLWFRQIIGPGPAFDPEVCRRRSLETVNAVVEGDQVLFPQPGVGTGERGVILPADPDQLAALDAWDTWKLSGISAEEEADLDALDQD